MTEITLRINNDIHISIKGHAGQAPLGYDVVCAGISTLTYTAAQIAAEYQRLGWLKKPPCIVLESGNAVINVAPKEKRRKRISDGYHSIITGYRLLAETYPAYVKFISLTA